MNKYEKTIVRVFESPYMIRIGTRSSPLALIQATRVRDALQMAHPNKRIVIVPFITRGDRITSSLHDIGGKALFTKEIQDALLSKTIDVAVHSLKDVELHELPLILGAYLSREAAHDVLIVQKNANIDNKDDALFLKTVAANQIGTLGTCSPRRCAQARKAWPDLNIVDLRGNVGTRLKQVVDGNIDATILAAAGLIRLDLMGKSFERTYPTLVQIELPIDAFIPAAGQGIIAVECRPESAELITPINDKKAQLCASIEREFSKYLGGNCRTALGVHVRFIKDIPISERQADESQADESQNSQAQNENTKSNDLDVLAFFEGRTVRRTFTQQEDSVNAYDDHIAEMATLLKSGNLIPNIQNYR